MAVALTVDSVVRSALMTSRKTIHYYIPFLHHAMRCINELKLGVLQVSKSVRLTVDAYGEVTIPTDYVDYVRIGWERGRYVVPLGERKTINRLPYLDAEGNQSTYPNPYVWVPERASGFYPSYHFNEYREHLGKFFGVNDSSRGDVFQVVIERGKIHLGSDFEAGDTIVLEYVYFDSTSTQSLVSSYAADAIEKYILWKWEASDRRSNQYKIENARRDYYNAHRVLLGRMNPITKEMIVRLSRRSFKQSIKT